VPTGVHPRIQDNPVPPGPGVQPPRGTPGDHKQVTCPYCEHRERVSEYAFSVACRHCNRRIELRDLDVRSHLRENIHSGSVVRILSSGSVRGAVRANEVIVQGSVNGDVVAGERLRITATGVVRGNLRTRRLEMEEGARFHGDANIGEQAFPPPIERRKRAASGGR
jgi:hypothetical protein